jgi:hypothetical protein
MKRYRCYRLNPERAREVSTPVDNSTKPLTTKFQVAFTEAIVWSTQSHEGIAPFLGVARGVEGPLDPGLYLVSPSFPAGTVMDYLSASPNADRWPLVSFEI